MATVEFRGFMKGKSTIAFKDELDHVAYHIYFSFVALFGLMFHIREGQSDGRYVPVFCVHHKRYLNRVHSRNLTVRFEVANRAARCLHQDSVCTGPFLEGGSCPIQTNVGCKRRRTSYHETCI